MDENIIVSVKELLRELPIHRGLVVDTVDGGHMIVEDVFVSTGYKLREESQLDYLVVLDVIDEDGELDQIKYSEFNEKKETKRCDECGSAQLVSYDKSGTVVCEECGREFTGSDGFEDTMEEMDEVITEAVENGEFEDRDMARWRITEWYLDELGAGTVHEELEISDDEIHLNEYDTESMTREKFREVLALEKLRHYDK